MRVAFVGKGGAGKSAIAGTFARTLARQGDPVLAIDSDPLPGLAFSLGLAVDDVREAGRVAEVATEEAPAFSVDVVLAETEKKSGPGVFGRERSG